MMPKFRVWDIDREQMLYTEEDLVVEFFDEGVVITDHTTFSSSCMDIDNFELMQSTGIKDINNREIYEGDIVHVLSHEAEFLTGEPFVQYDIKGEIIKKLGGFWIGDTPLCFLLNECNPSLTEINILGNIYQNSRLLKD